MGGFLDNLLNTVTPETIDKVIDKGVAAAETNGRKRLPDAGILAEARRRILGMSPVLVVPGHGAPFVPQ